MPSPSLSRDAPMMTPRRLRFVTEYLVDFNATQAAIRAGYSSRNANSAGPGLMRVPEVRAAIDDAAKREERRILLSADRVVLELMRVAFSDIRAYVTRDADGALVPRPRKGLTPNETAAIVQIAPAGKGRCASIRLHGKKHALGALARHVGFWDRRAFADPKLLNAEADTIRQRLFAAAGLDAMPALPAAAPDQARA
jgi:phage terminase small subunit